MGPDAGVVDGELLEVGQHAEGQLGGPGAVSYTHLTLPTSDLV